MDFNRGKIPASHPIFGGCLKLSDSDVLQPGDETACASILFSNEGGKWHNVLPEWEDMIGMTIEAVTQHDMDGWERLFRRPVMCAAVMCLEELPTNTPAEQFSATKQALGMLRGWKEQEESEMELNAQVVKLRRIDGDYYLIPVELIEEFDSTRERLDGQVYDHQPNAFTEFRSQYTKYWIGDLKDIGAIPLIRTQATL